jgi:hypothetical protein
VLTINTAMTDISHLELWQPRLVPQQQPDGSWQHVGAPPAHATAPVGRASLPRNHPSTAAVV